MSSNDNNVKEITSETTTQSPKKDPEVKPGSGEAIGSTNYNAMDKNNKKAADIMVSKGIDAAVEHMFKHPETGEKMDYATMRYFYG